MAKQAGILHLTGTLGEITFFEQDGHYYARRKSSLDKKRILTDPQFERTRENSSEFGMASRGYSLLRQAFLPTLSIFRTHDHRKSFIQLMKQLQQRDTMNVRGQRSVAQALQEPGTAELFNGLNFNSRKGLANVLLIRPDVDVTSGEIRIADLVPEDCLNYPNPATHAELLAYRADLDFSAHVFRTVTSEKVVFALDNQVQQPVLVLTGQGLDSGVRLFVLQVRFLQELNGELYPLKQEDAGAMQVVGVRMI